jgi:hypothetical protein
MCTTGERSERWSVAFPIVLWYCLGATHLPTMKHFKVAYEERLWIDGHGYSTKRRFQDIYAKGMDSALGKWSVMQLDNQSLICITEQP